MATIHAIKKNISCRSSFKYSVRELKVCNSSPHKSSSFPPYPKGMGRPKQKWQSAPATQKKGTERDLSPPFPFFPPSSSSSYARSQPKKRGRPAGSKSKVKVSSKVHVSMFESIFYDSGDVCNIWKCYPCQFYCLRRILTSLSCQSTAYILSYLLVGLEPPCKAGQAEN